jgi:hypothetical protein
MHNRTLRLDRYSAVVAYRARHDTSARSKEALKSTTLF